MKNINCIYEKVCSKECTNSCIRYLEVKYLLENSNIPRSKQKFNKLIPDECDIENFEILSAFKDNIVFNVGVGSQLYLYSPICGNGKTTWAIKIMLQYFNEVWAGNGFKCRGIFINVPTFLSKCREVISNPDSDFERLRTQLPYVDLVVWDDIATSKLSNYDYSILLNYIDQRVCGGKSNIYTGNVSPDKLSNILGNRLASRILGSDCDKIPLYGKDMR